MSLVEQIVAGGDTMNIVHNDQSIDLNEHSIAFNFAAKMSDGVQEDLEGGPEFFEDAIVEENEADKNFSAEFMQENKINMIIPLFF